ncbi:DUF6498-containing protein [Candidatus Woesearchaeota archaeon]|nr:DUF6498-containing protein [Candidatus Woesearchaeota archaeon]MCF7901438.1 DUF6498-containing protein [Candidatus Woesearchaeota archaeon]MCF8013016.1 DUF6498-containing protein [Candidatus Woesearchaeota archaeon]
MHKYFQSEFWYLDISLWTLLMANIISTYFIISDSLSLMTVLFIYWGQSVIIGLFNFIRMLNLKEYSTNNVKINNLPIKPSAGIKIFLALFFAFHYGLFHIGYLFFLIFGLVFNNLMSLGVDSKIDFLFVFLAILIFFGHHLFSYIYNRFKEHERAAKKVNIGRLMFFPYLRIVPMHAIIMFGILFSESISLIVFLILKTLADIAMHFIEHKS